MQRFEYKIVCVRYASSERKSSSDAMVFVTSREEFINATQKFLDEYSRKGWTLKKEDFADEATVVTLIFQRDSIEYQNYNDQLSNYAKV